MIQKNGKEYILISLIAKCKIILMEIKLLQITTIITGIITTEETSTTIFTTRIKATTQIINGIDIQVGVSRILEALLQNLIQTLTLKVHITIMIIMDGEQMVITGVE